MFFIEPLIWMFKTENFKNHFIKLVGIALICWISLMILAAILFNIDFFPSVLSNLIFIFFAIVLISVPFLCMTGYFWCLTDNIINRDLEVKANSVYNGKAQFIDKVTLPDWNIFRFVWRGIASIVATIILYWPIVAIVTSSILSYNILSKYITINVDPSQVALAYGILVVITIILVPALLWNYARRDSVFAVLNIFKAIYIVNTYPGKYFANAFLFLLYSVLHSVIIKAIVFVFGASIPVLSNASDILGLFTFSSIEMFIGSLVLIFLSYIIGVYWIFVNAYLLGTIAPPSEY